MLKLCDKIYVGRCSECEPALVKAHILIYLCHWPCARMKSNAWSQRQCRACEIFLGSGAKGRVHFFDVENLEIPRYRTEDFIGYLNLIDQALPKDDVILISERGESRAASLGLLWMAKRGKLLSRSSFAAARSDFARINPEYRPWPGWVIFFEQEWERLS